MEPAWSGGPIARCPLGYPAAYQGFGYGAVWRSCSGLDGRWLFHSVRFRDWASNDEIHVRVSGEKGFSRTEQADLDIAADTLCDRDIGNGHYPSPCAVCGYPDLGHPCNHTAGINRCIRPACLFAAHRRRNLGGARDSRGAAAVWDCECNCYPRRSR